MFPGVGSGRYLMPCCCACNEDYCNDGIVVHEGEVEYEQGICCGCLGQEVTTEGKAISKITQAATLTPQLNVFAEFDSEEPYASITGPCCFGGCSELCCESVFEYKKGDTPIATMSKLAPKSCVECCKEICTDVDKFASWAGAQVLSNLANYLASHCFVTCMSPLPGLQQTSRYDEI